MGQVWLTWDERLGVHRAIKLLDPALARSPTLRKRFDAEARAMARLQHPNTVTVHDVGDDDDQTYIVMELVSGGSLVDLVEAHGPLPPRTACELVAQVCEGLAAAHAQGIVHRDVKPHNVLLTAEGVPKLGDFGIAQVSTEAHVTRTGAVMGTLAYMAPEQRTDAKNVGPLADVYASGALLFFLVTGADPSDLCVPQVREKGLGPLPEPVARAIERATWYDPAQRFQSAAEMRGALLGAVALLPLPPGPLRVPDRPLPDPGGPRPTIEPRKDSATVDVDGLADTEADPPATAAVVPEVPPTAAPPKFRATGTLAVSGGFLALIAAVAAGAFAFALTVGLSLPPEPAVVVAPDPAPAEAAPQPVAEPVPAPIVAPAVAPGPRSPPGVRPASAAPAPVDAPDPLPPPEPAAAPAPVGPTGAVFVNSKPRGLPVLVDGVEVGTTPWSAGRWPAGSITVEILPVEGAAMSRAYALAPDGSVRLCWDFEANAVCRQ